VHLLRSWHTLCCCCYCYYPLLPHTVLQRSSGGECAQCEVYVCECVCFKKVCVVSAQPSFALPAVAAVVSSSNCRRRGALDLLSIMYCHVIRPSRCFAQCSLGCLIGCCTRVLVVPLPTPIARSVVAIVCQLCQMCVLNNAHLTVRNVQTREAIVITKHCQQTTEEHKVS
jgi:hypothetical protein